MPWSDIALLVFSCTMMNHLGLISAVEKTVGIPLPVLNCPRCLSFWAVGIYCALTRVAVVPTMAVSFLSAFSAVWFELFLGFVDTLYYKVYEKIYGNSPDGADTTTTNPDITGSTD